MKGNVGQAVPPQPLLAGPSSVFALYSVVGAGVLIGVAGAILGFADGIVAISAAVLLYGIAAAGVSVAMQRSYPFIKLGLCNVVTLARMVIVGVFVAAMLHGTPPGWALLGLAILSLSLDGVDGWLARRQKLSSEFGAMFDVEVDAAFALVLALYAATSGAAGPYVILLGIPHYMFWVARHIWPWLNAPLPPKFSRKAVCVLQIGTLIAVLVPFLAGPLRDGVVMAAALALVWSFGRDILWLYGSRA